MNSDEQNQELVDEYFKQQSLLEQELNADLNRHGHGAEQHGKSSHRGASGIEYISKDNVLASNKMNNENMNSGGMRFLDDIFTNSNLDPSSELHHFFSDVRNQNHSLTQEDINNSMVKNSFNQQGSYNDNAVENNRNAMTDFLFTQDNPNPELDLASSLGSSIHSDLNPSSYQPQPFSYNNNMNNLSSSLNTNNIEYLNSMRSPSTSLRGGNYLSSSLRQGSVGNVDYNATMTPSSVNSNSRFDNALSPTFSNSSYTAPSSSVPNKSLSHLTPEEKLKRKREFHNAVERRRRELIKEKIKELGKLVPPSLFMYDSITGKKLKANKGTILNKTVEYLTFLKDVVGAQESKKDKLLDKIQELENYNKQLGTHPTENASMVNDINNRNILGNSNERIIDARASSQVHSQIRDVSHGTDHSLYTSNDAMNQEPYYQQLHHSQQQHTPQIQAYHQQDDLDQFLSGALIEAEDNAQLMYNAGHDGTTPADYLLEFDTT